MLKRVWTDLVEPVGNAGKAEGAKGVVVVSVARGGGREEAAVCWRCRSGGGRPRETGRWRRRWFVGGGGRAQSWSSTDSAVLTNAGE